LREELLRNISREKEGKRKKERERKKEMKEESNNMFCNTYKICKAHPLLFG
jgi:hypothetical protein